jgi:hypothetical protein
MVQLSTDHCRASGLLISPAYVLWVQLTYPARRDNLGR